MNFKKTYLKSLLICCFFGVFTTVSSAQEIADKKVYLDTIKKELQKKWPNNNTINLVFHGHSVPAGYRTLGIVKPLESYPYQTLKRIKDEYPFAVVNVIVTAIGGENAKQGAERYEDEVLPHKPDVIFIDYALNDRSVGLEDTKKAWEKMIEAALAKDIKVVLMTPTPDYYENILSEESKLAKYSEQIRALAKTYNIALIDVYARFKSIAEKKSIAIYMAQNNHINDEGHKIVADLICEFFEAKIKTKKDE